MSLILTRGLGAEDGAPLTINILAAPADGLLYPALLDGVLNPIVELEGILIEEDTPGDVQEQDLWGSAGPKDLQGDF